MLRVKVYLDARASARIVLILTVPPLPDPAVRIRLREYKNMSQLIEIDIRDIVLANGSFGPQEIRQMVESVGRDTLQINTLRDAVNELESVDERPPASSVRLGVCQYLLGRYEDSIQTLLRADGGALTHFYLGRSYQESGKYKEAISSYEAASKAGYNPDECQLTIAGRLPPLAFRVRRHSCG